MRDSFRMKCLLCNRKNNKIEELKDHYVKYHNVDENNLFFKKLINEKKKNKKNVVHRRKCNYCNEFVFLNKADHDFLKHYERGIVFGGGSVGNSDNAVSDFYKPVTVTNTGTIRKFEITFKEHSSYYDFFDSVAVVDSFLAEIKNSVPRYDNDVLIRAGFSIENVQQVLNDYSEPLVQTSYWSTEPLQTKSFNDFVSFKIRESILRRVINNKLSGSAWNFNKFNYLNIKILNVSTDLMR